MTNAIKGLQISKNYFLGLPVASLKELVQLKNESKAVYNKKWKKTVPAAFIIGLPGQSLYISFIHKEIFYIVNAKEAKWVTFYTFNNGVIKVLTKITIEGYFLGEIQSTIELLSTENTIPEKSIYIGLTE